MGSSRYAVIVGIGLALFPVHNQWLAETFTINGEAILFLPVYGAVILFLSALFYMMNNYHRLNWGDKKIYVPLVVIAACIAVSGFGLSYYDGIASTGAGIILLSVYLLARDLKERIFLPVAIGSAIACLGVIVFGMMHPARMSGGFVFEGNYDIVVGYIMLGVAMFRFKYQWVFACMALVAMFMTGSPEGLFVVGVMAVIVLARRDWGYRLGIVLGIVVAVAWLNLTFGNVYGLYSHTLDVINDEETKYIDSSDLNAGKISVMNDRITVIVDAMTHITPLGKGYNLTDFSRYPNVHNVPLVIVQQLGWFGIVAGAAWVWVSMRCLIKTKWKYAWCAVLALSVFDHFIWTQLAPWWWAVVGITTAVDISDDRMFR